jgi:3-oxo-5-alpha-steroid 4-dehydrogenase 1
MIFQSATVRYELLRKLFIVVPPVIVPLNYMIDAPFGRFSPSEDSIFNVDGIKSWMIMELVAPIMFAFTFWQAPLNLLPNWTPHLKLYQPATLLSAFFLLHYLNRGIISPLRTPSRSKSHIIVPLCATFFNMLNGFLMGAYLSSPLARQFLKGAFDRPTFWFGLGLALVGLAGNILHDEILFDIRRKAKAKGKGKDVSNSSSSESKPKPKTEHYAIPHGWLFDYVSFPNYFCEWVEWLGFALAAAPFPTLGSQIVFFATLHPPWLFLLSELLLMTPRALKSHQWYKDRFPDYPKDRKVVIPYLL